MAYHSIDDFNFSVLNTGELYLSNDSVLSNSALNKMGWSEFESSIFVDFDNKDKYFAKRIRYFDNEEDKVDGKDEIIRKHYDMLITNPPMSNRIFWPKDIIMLSDEALENTTLMVANNYRVFDNDVKVDISPYALLFSLNGTPGINDIDKTLDKFISEWKEEIGETEFNYTHSVARILAYALAWAINDLNESGYLYNDIDISRFLLDKSGQIVLDFSNLVYSREELDLMRNNKWYIEEPKEYPLTFAEPTLFQGKINIPDEISQNYSLAAIIFYILFGFEPYNGVLYDYFDSSTRMSHFNKCQQYLNNPIFVFDIENDINHLGSGRKNDEYKKLWGDCPNIIKDFFIKTFMTDNATRTHGQSEAYAPKPMDWVNTFYELGWI